MPRTSDTPEQIEMCQSCLRARCVNCLAYKGSGEKCKYDYARIRELYLLGLTDHEIAGRLGCNRMTVYKWRTKEGLAANVKGKKDVYAPHLNGK